jgi:peptide subunit release factor 1 (eRF1)
VTTLELVAPETPVHVAAPTSELLDRLARVNTGRPVVVSLYVRLDVQDRIRNRYRIAARDAIRQLVESVGHEGLPHTEREALHRDLARVQGYLDDPAGLPHAHGLALFACESEDLFEVVALPRVVQTRLLLGTRPRLAEVLAALEGFGRMVVALVDRGHSRFFVVTASDVHELSGLSIPFTRGGKYHSDRADAPGWGEHDFHNRIREERHRHAAAVAHQLTVLVRDQPCQGIILAGPVKTVADQRRFLPKGLAGRLLGTARLNPTSATADDVRRAAFEVRASWEKAHEAAVVADLEEGIATGWAVIGAKPTLRALDRGQVRLLIVAAGISGAGYRCKASGRLALARADCRDEGEAEPVPDMVSEALDEAFRQHADVEIIDDPELKERVDGLAGLLRFR